MDEKTVSYDAVETKNNKKRKACEKNSLFQVYTVDAFLNNLKKEESERKALKKFCEQANNFKKLKVKDDLNLKELDIVNEYISRFPDCDHLIKCLERNKQNRVKVKFFFITSNYIYNNYYPSKKRHVKYRVAIKPGILKK